MQRTLVKGARDLAVLAVTTVLLALANRAADFGVPAELVPLVSAGALALYRIARDAAGKTPA